MAEASSIWGYPVPGKAKSVDLLECFIAGHMGAITHRIPRELHAGAAAFYGVTEANHHLYRQAVKQQRTHYMIDNAYIDQCREHWFRITKNRMQHDGTGEGSPSRFEYIRNKFKLESNVNAFEIKPWRTDGSFILLCPQSDKFMQLHPGITGWATGIAQLLRLHTDREIRVQSWNRDKALFYRRLPEALKGAHAVVTWSSAAANTATFLGVPAFVMAEDCIARPWLNTDIAQIENPRMDVDREAFGAMLAKWQFTRAEMRSGYAYNVVNGNA